MDGNRQNKPSEADIWAYVAYHTNEDWSMEQTVEDFYNKVWAFKDYLKQFEKEVA